MKIKLIPALVFFLLFFSPLHAQVTQETVDKIAQLQKEIAPDDPSHPPPKDLLLTGSLHTEDHQPLSITNEPLLNAHTSAPGSEDSTPLELDADSRFSQKVQRGLIFITASAPGYAPLIVGPLEPTPDNTLPAQNLTLTKGFPSVIRFADPQGNLIPNAKATLAYQGQSPSTTCCPEDFTADSTGTLHIPHALDRPAILTIETPGYEYDRLPIHLSSKEPIFLMLYPAKPAAGIVRDTHGNPIPNATIFLLARKGFNDHIWYPSPAEKLQILATTDAAGRFTLTTLREDCFYSLRISAPHYASQVLQHIRAGDQNLTVILQPPHPIHVQLQLAPGAIPPAEMKVSNFLSVTEGFSSLDFKIPVVVENGIAHATLADPLQGSYAYFSVGGKSVDVPAYDFQNEAADATLDLSDQTPESKRTLIIHFDVPDGSPPPQGKFHLRTHDENTRRITLDEYLPIKDGEARCEVTVPCRLLFSSDGLCGYLTTRGPAAYVPDDKESFTYHVPLQPAGAVHGRITNADGTPFKKTVTITLLTIRSPDQPKAESQPKATNRLSSRYLLTHIPFGGTYRVLAFDTSILSTAALAVSDEFTIDADHPIQEINLTFPKGITFSGTVLGPDDKPRSGINVSLSLFPFGTDINGQYASTRTDRNGNFRIDQVNLNLESTFNLIISPGKDTQGLSFNDFKPSAEPLKIQLKEGRVVHGTVVDDATGKPAPYARITINPSDNQAQYPHEIEAVSDAEGRFTFFNLESICYSVYISNAYPPGSKIIHTPGGIQVEQTGGESFSSIDPDSADPLEIRAVFP